MPQRKHILVVEDERHLAVGIKYNLEAEGYEVTTVGDGPSALQFLEENFVDLLILDLMLPGMSGYAVCESLRNQSSDLPVLILSARNRSEDRVQGFNVGANQYLSKPFDLDELLSRVKNLLLLSKREARAEHAPSTLKTYEFSGWHIDFNQCEVKRGDTVVTLTKRELKLLQFFAENEGRLISRQELLEKVWELPGHAQTRTPDQFLLRLRKIFEADTANPQHFLTMRDLGYKFIANPDRVM